MVTSSIIKSGQKDTEADIIDSFRIKYKVSWLCSYTTQDFKVKGSLQSYNCSYLVYDQNFYERGRRDDTCNTSPLRTVFAFAHPLFQDVLEKIPRKIMAIFFKTTVWTFNFLCSYRIYKASSVPLKIERYECKKLLPGKNLFVRLISRKKLFA